MAGFLPNDLTNITGAPQVADVFVTQQDGAGDVKKLTYAELTQRGIANGLCPLDGNAKIPTTNLPALAITNVYVVADIAARDAITPIETGDTVKVNDSGAGFPQTYIYDGSVFIDIQESSDVISVNGATGVVVLTTADIGVATDANFVTDAELASIGTMGTADNNVLTDAQLALVNSIDTTDHNTLTDVELAKLTALEGTDKRVLTDVQLASVNTIGTADNNILTDIELAKLTALEGTDKRVLTDLELAKLQALEGTDKVVLSDIEYAKLNALEGTDKRVLTDVELAKLTALEGTDKNVLTDTELAEVQKISNVFTLTSAATITPDMSTHSQFAVLVDQNFTLENPTGLSDGQTGYIQIVQDATGSRVLTLGTNYKTVGGAGITLSTAASAVDVIEFIVLSSTAILLKDFKNIS